MDKIPRNVAHHKFAYSDSDKRKKVDGFKLFCNGVAEDIRDKCDQKSLKSKPKYDMRKSFAWDSAFTTNSGFLEIDELFNISSSWQSPNGSCSRLGHEEDHLLPIKYPEPELKIPTDEFNFRKSLAWDSAFFTSEGILNPEELSLVNKGFKKSEISMLSTIEELRISCESNCTTQSDGSSLAWTEVKPMEDIRAEMHQLREASSTRASSSREQRLRNMQKAHSTKRMEGEGAPKLKVKPRPTYTSQAMNGNQPEGIAKETSTSQFRKFGGGIGITDPSSHTKPPKILGRVRNFPEAPNKRVPLFSNEVNGERKVVKATNGKCLSQKPHLLEFSSLSLQSSQKDIKAPRSSYKFSTAKNGESNVSPSDMENMCPNLWSEVKGSNSVSFDASRNLKPSGLRMPSAKIGFFDVDNSQLAKENGSGNSHSGT